MNLAIENGLTAEQISKLAPYYGISTEDAGKVAGLNNTLYGDNVTKEESATPNTTFEDVFYKTSGEGDNATVEVKTASEAKVSYDEAKKRYEAGEIPEDEWRTIEATYEMEYGNGDIVSIYSKTFDENSFGKFKKGDEQKDLISAIVLMAEGNPISSDGKALEKGDVVLTNYGAGDTTNAIYKYLGNGKFEKVKDPEYKNLNIVAPEGYEVVKTQQSRKDDLHPIEYSYQIKKKK
jgi:hypothetical protein